MSRMWFDRISRRTRERNFSIDGKSVLVENIPAQVCAYCGEEIFSRETTEKVRLIIHGKKKPIKSVQMDVFAYA